MRINVYNEEIEYTLSTFEKVAETGVRFFGVRMWLKSPDDLHHTEDDDDRSAITWFFHNGPTSELLADLFANLATATREAWRLRTDENSYATQRREAVKNNDLIVAYLRRQANNLEASGNALRDSGA